MGRRRASAVGDDAALIALVAWVRALLDERGLSYAAVARTIPCHPSTVSRALSGRRLPAWSTMQRIVARCGGCAQQARRLWEAADASRHALQRRDLEGHPPPDVCSYGQLIRALRELLTRQGLSQRQLVRQDDSGILRRSTVGAVLRRERSLRQEVAIAMVRACGVSDAAVDDWANAWLQYGLPFEEAMEHRRRQIASARLRPPAPWRGGW